MTKTTINFEEDVFKDVDDTSLKALADKCKLLEFAEQEVSELEDKLKDIMLKIHNQCVEYGKEDGYVNYVRGANVAGFKKVADAMLAYGVV